MTEAVQALQPGISLAPDTSSVVDRGKFERDVQKVQSLERTFTKIDEVFKSPDSFLTFLGTNQVAQIGFSTLFSIVPPVRVAFEGLSTGYVRYKKACADNAGFAEKFKIIGEYGLRTGAAFATGGVSELAYAAGRGAISLLQGKPKWESLAYAATAFAGGIAGGNLAGSIASAPVTKALFANAGRLAGAEFTGHLIEIAIGDEEKKHDFRIARAGVAGLMAASALAQSYPALRIGATQRIQDRLIDFKENQLDRWNDRLQKFFNPDDYAPISPDTEPAIPNPNTPEQEQNIEILTNRNDRGPTSLTQKSDRQNSVSQTQSTSKGLYGYGSHVNLNKTSSENKSNISRAENMGASASAPPPPPGMGEFRTKQDIQSLEATLAAASSQDGLEPHPTFPDQYRYTLPDNLNVEDTIDAMNLFIRDVINIEVATPFARSYNPANPSTENTVSFDFTFAHPSGNTYTIPVELNNREFVDLSSSTGTTFSAYISQKAESSMLSRGIFYDPSGNAVNDRNGNGIIDLEDFEITWDMPRSPADNYRYTRIFHNNLWNQAVNNTPELRANLDPTLPNDPNYPTNFYGPLEFRGRNNITLAERVAADMNQHPSDQTALVRNISSIPFVRDFVNSTLGNSPPNYTSPLLEQAIGLQADDIIQRVSRHYNTTGESIEIKTTGSARLGLTVPILGRLGDRSIIIDPSGTLTGNNIIGDPNGDGVITRTEIMQQLYAIDNTADVATLARMTDQLILRASQQAETRLATEARFSNPVTLNVLPTDGSQTLTLFRSTSTGLNTGTGLPENISITPNTDTSGNVVYTISSRNFSGQATSFAGIQQLLQDRYGNINSDAFLTAYIEAVQNVTPYSETNPSMQPTYRSLVFTTQPYRYAPHLPATVNALTDTPAELITRQLLANPDVFSNRDALEPRTELDNWGENLGRATEDISTEIGNTVADINQGTNAYANLIASTTPTYTANFQAGLQATAPTGQEVITATTTGIDNVNQAIQQATGIVTGTVNDLDNLTPPQAQEVGQVVADTVDETVFKHGNNLFALIWGFLSGTVQNAINRFLPPKP